MAKAHPATELSLKKLRADSRFLLVEKVEHNIPRPGRGFPVKRDLFEIIDILAVGPGITMGVQCTSVGGVSDRKRKLIEHPNTRIVLAAGWQLEIWGWHQPAGPRSRWELGRRHHFELDFPDQETP